MKEKVIILIKITQDEADHMRSKQFDGLIHISSATHKGRAKRYYMTEDKKGLRVLKDYREKRVTTTYK